MMESIEQTEVPFTVLTFNVGNGLANPRGLAAFLRSAGADVVGLQELAHTQAAVLGDLLDLYPNQVLLPEGFAGKGLLSRHAIREHEILSLQPNRPDLRAMIEIDGAILTVLVAHPPPPRFARTRLVFNPATLAQISALASLAIEHEPALLLGDFNLTPRSPVYASLVAAGLVDAFAAAGSGRDSTLPRRAGQSSRIRHGLHRLPLWPMVRVDYIWCTPGIRIESAWVGPDAGSDHLPVLAQLALAPD